MDLQSKAITTLVSEGYVTLQIPMSYLGNVTAYESLPDDYFIRLKDYRPAVGNEQAGTYLTRKGYEALKDRLKANFSTRRGRTWEEFEAHAEKHFQIVYRKTIKFATSLRLKLNEVNAYLQEMENDVSDHH